ncbi:MAG: hypothetical protein QXI11_00905 [Thermoproteota archaeon]
MKCPVCGKGELLRYEGIPEALDIIKLAEKHPVPIIRNWVREKASEVKKSIEDKYYYRKCNKCGCILFFEVV